MTRRRWIAAVGLAVTALCLLISGMAAATCGDTTKARPGKKINPKGRAPLVLGDSVMVFAVPPLAHRGYRANAQECRQFLTGVGVIRDKRARNRLPHLVVLALGANGPVTTEGIKSALHALPKNKVLGLVTPRGGVAGGTAGAMRTVAHHHHHRVVLLDWVRYSSRHAGASGWFAGDGLHLTYSGAAAYARFISKALPWARSGRFPHSPRFPRS
jgi:hypothetical protein